jgi:hypothetical protein
VAIRNEIGGARLLIFDHTIEGTPIRQVFSWDGKQMVQVLPSAADQEILAALGARDDAGSWNKWVFFRSLRLPVLAGYYVLLAGIVGSLIILRKIQTTRNEAAIVGSE